MCSRKTITILGVTGSVGQSTMDVVLSAPDSFDVHAITANENIELLASSAIKLNAKKVVVANPLLESDLIKLLENTNVEIYSGSKNIEKIAGEPVDLVMAAIMGFAGLRPIVRALEQGTNVAIANKEPLVAAGQYIMNLAKQNNAKVLPVDSEHNAIFQVFEKHNRGAIDKIILTASGGPFLNWSKENIAVATPAQAIAHPNWTMGKKISVDSASMMNKALEIIEAHYLFCLPADKIEVIIHPQSIIHSLVSYIDGSVLSQMGASDMRTPIAYTLGYPNRIESVGAKIDFDKLTSLTFEKPDFDKFPALTYAYKCLNLGQGACITLNAANEVAVDLFLNNDISFADITKIIAYAVDELYPTIPIKKLKTIEDIEKLDKTVRLGIKDYRKLGL